MSMKVASKLHVICLGKVDSHGEQQPGRAEAQGKAHVKESVSQEVAGER